MLRWLNSRKAQDSPDGGATVTIEASREVTDDPLAAIDPNRKGQKIYSVSRINPLFDDNLGSSTLKRSEEPQMKILSKDYSPSGEKSNSSGYGGSYGEGSSHDHPYTEKVRLRDDVVSVLEQNANYVKSIQVAAAVARKKSVPSLASGSSAAGTLTTIPEGKVDFGIPKPIWPNCHEIIDVKQPENLYDSIVDEALLLYTSVDYVPKNEQSSGSHKEFTMKDILVDLSNCISATIEGNNGLSPEQMLTYIKEKLLASLDIIRNSTEEEMRRLCVNLSNREKVNSVVRAFSNSSSSGHSSQSSPELNSARVRTVSADTEDIYHVPSGSSSSGFSDSVKPYGVCKRLPPHEDIALDPDGIRNALIYGTLCRAHVKSYSANEKLLDKENKGPEQAAPKKSLLQASRDSKPSVWQQYYGVNLIQEGDIKYVGKPTDIPLYIGRHYLIGSRRKSNKSASAPTAIYREMLFVEHLNLSTNMR